MCISLLNHADRVKAGCLAQWVNVIAPIMTETGGPAFFAIPAAPHLKVAAVADARGGLNLFALNRNLQHDLTVEVTARGFGTLAVTQAHQLRHDDLQACNTAAAPSRVQPAPLKDVTVNGPRVHLTLAPASWNATCN